MNHLFEECHLFPAGSLGDIAVITIPFSLRNMSDFPCDPTESAILSGPQFLHLLNENIIPQPFLLQKDIVRIKWVNIGENILGNKKYNSTSIIRIIKGNNSNKVVPAQRSPLIPLLSSTGAVTEASLFGKAGVLCCKVLCCWKMKFWPRYIILRAAATTFWQMTTVGPRLGFSPLELPLLGRPCRALAASGLCLQRAEPRALAEATWAPEALPWEQRIGGVWLSESWYGLRLLQAPGRKKIASGVRVARWAGIAPKLRVRTVAPLGTVLVFSAHSEQERASEGFSLPLRSSLLIHQVFPLSLFSSTFSPPGWQGRDARISKVNQWPLCAPEISVPCCLKSEVNNPGAIEKTTVTQWSVSFPKLTPKSHPRYH